MSPKLKRLFAVETMKATVPELFAKVKKEIGRASCRERV